MPAREIASEISPPPTQAGAPVLDHFDLTIPPVVAAIVGRMAPAKPTRQTPVRLYDPQAGCDRNRRHLTCESSRWSRGVLASPRVPGLHPFEMPLRENVAPGAGAGRRCGAALASAGASNLASLDTVLARWFYRAGRTSPGGQWQRVALARALLRRAARAGVMLLDERRSTDAGGIYTTE